MIKKRSINIIDYNMGNARSVQNALNKLTVQSNIVSRPEELKNSVAIILPGVGSFKKAVENLKIKKLFKEIDNLVITKRVPFLGICLGMQLIAKDSTENKLTDGFGWVKARVRKMDLDKKYRLPHVGWNQITRKGNPILLSRVQNLTNYYFDHTYAFFCDNSKLVSSTVKYGDKTIISSIEDGHIFGTQFHPEKSQLNGLRIIKAFIEFVYSNQQC